ncbi:hypothetical protein QJQ45_006768 [Haematococcus lacustris]|nr:hypothetical protein QJQ45_006768 [Haematococcus lacustris]
MAQRRAAEAAGPIEFGAQAGAVAAEAEAQADAGADEADAQLHQLQADPQHSEQQLAHNQRMQHLQQQLQDLQRSELHRKEQQLADSVAQQRSDLLQWEQQLTERQHQLEQQQADLSRREQELTERQHQLQQQQADLDSREQQQARIQTLPQQLHSLQQELLQQQQADLLLMQQQVEKQHLAYLRTEGAGGRICGGQWIWLGVRCTGVYFGASPAARTNGVLMAEIVTGCMVQESQLFSSTDGPQRRASRFRSRDTLELLTKNRSSLSAQHLTSWLESYEDNKKAHIS